MRRQGVGLRARASACGAEQRRQPRARSTGSGGRRVARVVRGASLGNRPRSRQQVAFTLSRNRPVDRPVTGRSTGNRPAAPGPRVETGLTTGPAAPRRLSPHMCAHTCVMFSQPFRGSRRRSSGGCRPRRQEADRSDKNSRPGTTTSSRGGSEGGSRGDRRPDRRGRAPPAAVTATGDRTGAWRPGAKPDRSGRARSGFPDCAGRARRMGPARTPVKNPVRINK